MALERAVRDSVSRLGLDGALSNGKADATNANSVAVSRQGFHIFLFLSCFVFDRMRFDARHHAIGSRMRLHVGDRHEDRCVDARQRQRRCKASVRRLERSLQHLVALCVRRAWSAAHLGARRLARATRLARRAAQRLDARRRARARATTRTRRPRVAEHGQGATYRALAVGHHWRRHREHARVPRSQRRARQSCR